MNKKQFADFMTRMHNEWTYLPACTSTGPKVGEVKWKCSFIEYFTERYYGDADDISISR